MVDNVNNTIIVESETTNSVSNITEEVIIEQQQREVNISFGANANSSSISEYTKDILRRVGAATENYQIDITSTARSPYDQARIMYNNIVRDINEQRRIYRQPGQEVIDVYESESNLGRTREQIITAMKNKIVELGPSTVSHHCADSNVINVFDIAISTLTNAEQFLTNIKTEADKVLVENRCYHIEISQ